MERAPEPGGKAAAGMLAALPVLLSADIGQTIAFYEAKLGFRCRHTQPGMAILVRDGIELLFTHCPRQDCIEWSCCRIQVADIDALHRELTATVAEHPNGRLGDTAHGTREFSLLDCHGVLLTFFQQRRMAPAGG